MKLGRSKWVLGIAALVMVVAFGATADAAPISKCNAAKKKCMGKYVAAVLGCHAKAEGKGVAVVPECISKAVAKITGAGKGCFDKNDAKVGNDCSMTGNATQQIAEADSLIDDVVKAVDPAYPAPTLTKCGAARKKCAGKKAAGLLGCAAKANKDGIGDAACAPKIEDKFSGAKGCDVNALVKGTDCLGTATTGDLETRIDAYRDSADFSLDYVGPTCGDGLIEPGEFCDPNGLTNPGAACGTAFACVACNCACATKIHFVGSPSDPATQLDVGWTGIAHRGPIVSNGDVTVSAACGPTTHPCGTCTLNGPIANTGPNQLHNQRCTNDTSIQCTTDAPCLGGGGTCQFFFGTTLPLASGGVGTCVVNQFDGALTGTANFETGESYSIVFLESRVFTGPTDNPCPRCIGDATINDNVQGGMCDSGPRIGLACDGNGSVAVRPDFGTTSLDCPPAPGVQVAKLSIDLSNGTDTVVKTLSAASPNCGDGSGQKCLCDTCNNGAAEACSSNADCPDPAGPIGAICGGKRCIGGTNEGAACVSTTECAGGGLCARPGEPSKPSACLDDTTTPGVFDCSDTAPVDDEGICTAGPVTKTCSVASGHGQRGCGVDADCGGGTGTCVASNRGCFLTGGFTGTVGTNSLMAKGLEDVPSLEVSHPTLASIYCVAPTSASTVNGVAGLPGPSRLLLKGTATGLP